MATVSYVRITNLSNGNALSGDGSTWTPVTGVTYGTSPSGSGATPGDLGFTLTQSGGIASALKNALESPSLVQVEVATYDTSTATATSAGTLLSYDVYGAKGAPAYLDGESLQGSSGDTYSVAAQAVSHTAYVNGKPAAQSALSGGTSVPPILAPADVATGNVAGPAVAAPSLSGLTYYAEFKNASGSYVQGTGGSTWFAITGPSSSLGRGVSYPSGYAGRAEVGTLQASEVSFGLADPGVDPSLFVSALTNYNGQNVQIEAVDASGKVVDSTTYQNALVSAYTSGSTGTSINLNFTGFYNQHVGTTGAVTGSGYNLATQMTATSSIADPIVTLNTAGAAPPASGTYSLNFGPMTGLAASDVAYAFGRGISTASGSAGRQIDSPSVSEVTLQMPEGVGAAYIDSRLTNNTAQQSVTVNRSSGSQTLEALTLAYALVSGDGIDLVTGIHSLSLNYTRIGLSGVGPSPTAPSSVTYDLTATTSGGTNSSGGSAGSSTGSSGGTAGLSATPTATRPDTTVSVSLPPAPAPAPVPADTAYVQFRDASGNVVTAGPNGQSWFQVSAGSVGFSRGIPTVAGPNGSVRVPGSLSASQLQLTLGSNAIEAKLDGLMGTSGLTVEVANYSNGALAGDYIFANAGPAARTAAGASDTIDFNYKQFQETGYTPGARTQTASVNVATPSAPFSVRVLAPAAPPAVTNPAPAALTTYVEIVDKNGNPITGNANAPFVLATNVDVPLLQAATSATGVTAAPIFSLDIADGSSPSALDVAAGSTATAFGVVLVSYDAANPSKLVSYQTLGGYSVTRDTLDGAGQRELSFAADTTAGSYTGSPTLQPGYTEQVADDNPGDGYTSFATVGTKLPSIPGSLTTGIGSQASASTTSTPSYTVEIVGANGAAVTGTTSNGFLTATGVTLDFVAHTASFSVAASALTALTAALAAGKPVTVSLQGATPNLTQTYTLGGSSGSVATITGASLDATTGLADVSVSFTGAPAVSASGSGGYVQGVETYPDQMVVTPTAATAAGQATFDISFTNGLAPALSASNLVITDGSNDGGTPGVTGDISLTAGTTPGTYVATVSNLSGGGPFSIDATTAFLDGTTNSTGAKGLSPTDQTGSDVLATDTTDGTQSLTVAAPGSPTTTTTFSTATGLPTQTVVLKPDSVTRSVTTTYAPGGTAPTLTATLSNSGTYVTVAPGTSGDPAGAAGTITSTYASNTAATPLTTVYENAAGTPTERVDNTGSGVKTTVYTSDGTTAQTVTTLDPDGSKEVYQLLSTGPFASSDDLYDTSGNLTQATYTRAGGVLAEVDTFGTGGTKTVALYDTTGAPSETTVTNADGTSSVTQYEAAGPYASVTTTYGATGTQTGQTEAARAPNVALTSAGGPVTTPTVTVTGSIDIPGVAGTVQLAVNGAAAGSPVALNPDGSFSAVLPFSANGTYDVTATATTAAGGIGTTATPVEYTVSDIAPTLAFTSAPVTSASAAQTITGLVTPSGTATVAGQTVTLTENGAALATAAPVTVAADGTFSADVTLPSEGANAIQASVVDSLGNAASASITETLDQMAPVVSSPTLTVAPGAGPTAVGIAAPSDDVTAPGALAIVVGGLPSDGSLTLADGSTPVTVGMNLSVAQLGGLLFTPTAGLADQTSTFSYSVTDGAGNSSTGAATLAIGDPVPAPAGSMASPAAPASAGGSDQASSPAPAAPVPSVPVSAGGTGQAPSPTLPTPVTTVDGDGLTTTTVFNADGSTAVTVSGGPFFDDKPYASFTRNLAADGTLLSAVRDRNDGSHGVFVNAVGQTLNSEGDDTFSNGGRPDTTFVFTPGYGHDFITLFRPDGDDHDTLSFQGSDFGSTPAGQLADLLAHSQDRAGNLVITDPTSHDRVTLVGVTKDQLVQNQKDILFRP